MPDFLIVYLQISVDSIEVFRLRMVTVKSKLILHPKGNQHRSAHADGEPQEVEAGVKPVVPKVTDGVFEHTFLDFGLLDVGVLDFRLLDG